MPQYPKHHTACAYCEDVRHMEYIQHCYTCGEAVCDSCADDFLYVIKHGDAQAKGKECDKLCKDCLDQMVDEVSNDELLSWCKKQLGLKRWELVDRYRAWLLAKPEGCTFPQKDAGKRSASDAELDALDPKVSKAESAI